MNFWGHLKTVHHHRALVRKYCFRLGLYWQGLTHDLSKYSPVEFWAGVKYFQGTRSPNDAQRREQGYSASWMHHKGRNRHHFEYWTDYTADGISGIEKATTIANQMAANNWVLVDGTTNVYQLKVDDADVVTTAGTTLPVFEQVNISGEVDADELNAVSGETIEITAYAIQASGFTSAKQAWDAAIASGDITA